MAKTHALLPPLLALLFTLLFLILPVPLIILLFFSPLPEPYSWVQWVTAGFAAWGFHRHNLCDLVPGIFSAFSLLHASYLSDYPMALVDVYSPDFSPPRVACDCTSSGFCDPWAHDFKYVQIPMVIARRESIHAWR